MWGPMGDVITHAQYQLNHYQGLGSYENPNFPISYT